MLAHGLACLVKERAAGLFGLGWTDGVHMIADEKDTFALCFIRGSGDT